MVERLKERAGFGRGFGDRSRAVVDAYAKAFPGRKPVEIWSLASSNRQSVVALVRFMRSGDPNGTGLPSWPRYSSARGETMILDDACEVRDDPDREVRKAEHARC